MTRQFHSSVVLAREMAKIRNELQSWEQSLVEYEASCENLRRHIAAGKEQLIELLDTLKQLEAAKEE